MNHVSLRHYDNSWYSPGRSFPWRVAWLVLISPLFRAAFVPSPVRVALLRIFGATLGKRVVIKPGVTVKYPWHLVVGDDCWIGENSWIDNLTTVRLDSNVCISQGAYLCTGNHDWTDPGFGLRVAPIHLMAGAWAGAKSILTPGTVLREGAIAGAGSVVIGEIPEYAIFAGNPAVFVRHRVIQSKPASDFVEVSAA